MKIFLGILVCAVITSTALAGDAPKPEASKVRSELDAMQGKAAPALQLDNWMNATPMQLADLKGKIVVLDFWATWCGPCINSIPHANEISKKYADQGVVFVGVCAQRGAEKMKETAGKHKIEYPIAADSAGKTVEAYKVNSYPDYYIIDRKGVLRWADFANGDVEKAIETLLAEK